VLNLFPWIKEQGSEFDELASSNTEVNGRVDLKLYSPVGVYEFSRANFIF